MSDVEKFYPANAAENPDNVLEQAVGQYDQVLILGWDKNGDFDGRCSTGIARAAEALFLIEVFKARLMNGDFYGDE